MCCVTWVIQVPKPYPETQCKMDPAFQNDFM